jgi:hypothetical protein
MNNTTTAYHEHELTILQARTTLSTISADGELTAERTVLLGVNGGVDRVEVVSDSEIPGWAVVEDALLHVATGGVGPPRAVDHQIAVPDGDNLMAETILEWDGSNGVDDLDVVSILVQANALVDPV